MGRYRKRLFGRCTTVRSVVSELITVKYSTSALPLRKSFRWIQSEYLAGEWMALGGTVYCGKGSRPLKQSKIQIRICGKILTRLRVFDGHEEWPGRVISVRCIHLIMINYYLRVHRYGSPGR